MLVTRYNAYLPPSSNLLTITSRFDCTNTYLHRTLYIFVVPKMHKSESEKSVAYRPVKFSHTYEEGGAYMYQYIPTRIQSSRICRNTFSERNEPTRCLQGTFHQTQARCGVSISSRYIFGNEILRLSQKISQLF